MQHRGIRIDRSSPNKPREFPLREVTFGQKRLDPLQFLPGKIPLEHDEGAKIPVEKPFGDAGRRRTDPDLFMVLGFRLGAGGFPHEQ